eukprot:6193645-Prymnesium_polylepis.1
MALDSSCVGRCRSESSDAPGRLAALIRPHRRQCGIGAGGCLDLPHVDPLADGDAHREAHAR